MPVARYGPPDDPDSGNEPTRYGNYGNEPTRYSNYGREGGYADTGAGGYGQPPDNLEPQPPVPWYRKPGALVALGAVGAVLVALVVYGLAKVIAGGDSPSDTTTTSLTPLTTTSAPVLPPASSRTETPTTTTEPVTTTTTEPTTTTTTEPTTTTTTTTTPAPTTTVSISTSTSTITQTITVPPVTPPGG